MKDVLFETQDSKQYFLKYHVLCSELSKVNKKHFEDSGTALEDKFEVHI
jgi:hypothetical protein